MVSPITEIVKDLAAQIPGANSEQITEIIINSIESEPIISDVISRIQVPTKSQIKLAELRSNRFPKGKRARTLERIENANFFKKLQLMYIIPIQDSDLRQSIHRDGARVDLSYQIEYSDSSYQRLSKTRSLDVDKTYEGIQFAKDTPRQYSHSVITKEMPAQNTKENKESFSSMLQEIDEGFEASSDCLSLYNIYQIIRIMETSHDQEIERKNMNNIFRADINMRNK